jgi:hypothetical protein
VPFYLDVRFEDIDLYSLHGQLNRSQVDACLSAMETCAGTRKIRSTSGSAWWFRMESMALLRAVCDYRIDWFAPHVQPFLLSILAMEKAQPGHFAQFKNNSQQSGPTMMAMSLTLANTTTCLTLCWRSLYHWRKPQFNQCEKRERDT